MNKLSDITFVFDEEEPHKDLSMPLLSAKNYRTITDNIIYVDVEPQRSTMLHRFDTRPMIDIKTHVPKIESYNNIYPKVIVKSNLNYYIEVNYDNYSGIVVTVNVRSYRRQFLNISMKDLHGSPYTLLYCLHNYIETHDNYIRFEMQYGHSIPILLDEVQDEALRLMSQYSENQIMLDEMKKEGCLYKHLDGIGGRKWLN